MFYNGDIVRRFFAKYEEDFPDLQAQIKAAIMEEAPHTIAPVWRKRSKTGHVIRGAKVTVEVQDRAGKTSIFEAMMVRGNDRRNIVQVKQGSFSLEDAARFCAEYGGEMEPQGGKP
jgi:hypothetical protein